MRSNIPALLGIIE